MRSTEYPESMTVTDFADLAEKSDMLLKLLIPLNQFVIISANSWTDYGFRVKPGMTSGGWWVVPMDSG